MTKSLIQVTVEKFLGFNPETGFPKYRQGLYRTKSKKRASTYRRRTHKLGFAASTSMKFPGDKLWTYK